MPLIPHPSSTQLLSQFTEVREAARVRVLMVAAVTTGTTALLVAATVVLAFTR